MPHSAPLSFRKTIAPSAAADMFALELDKSLRGPLPANIKHTHVAAFNQLPASRPGLCADSTPHRATDCQRTLLLRRPLAFSSGVARGVHSQARPLLQLRSLQGQSQAMLVAAQPAPLVPHPS
jgi:hypothetical protein